MTYQEYQEKINCLYSLRAARAVLEKYYPTMDLTDFEMAIYSLEDDIDEDVA